MNLDNYYIIQLPLKNEKYNYEFSTIIGDSSFILWIYYNRRMERFILNIKDENNDSLLMGIPLLVGARIVRRFANDKLIDLKYLSVYNTKDGKSEIDENNVDSAFVFTLKEII